MWLTNFPLLKIPLILKPADDPEDALRPCHTSFGVELIMAVFLPQSSTLNHLDVQTAFKHPRCIKQYI